jgi:quinoprotein glucose dehydrogenase
LVISVVCGACACAASRWAATHGFGMLYLLQVPPWIAVLTTLVALDLVSYVWHRANHLVGFLWRFHRVHHSDRNFTVTTGVRFHPGELLLSLPLRLAAVVLLGAPPYGVLAFELIFTVANLIEHGDIDYPRRFDGMLARLFVTPSLHRRHHTRRRPELDSNFGTVFSTWDRLLGTYRAAVPGEPIATGVPGLERDLRLLEALRLPFGARIVTSLVLVALFVAVARGASAASLTDWPYTEGHAGSGRYSPLADIHRGNVARLQIAWTYRHGDFHNGGWRPDHINRGTSFESTPIVVDGRLIFTTPYNRVIALDPETGSELWAFDPRIELDRFFANMIINRGVAHWRSETGAGRCQRRVFLATLDARLIALDAATGAPCADFGTNGSVDLLAGVQPLVDAWEYNVTSPATVVGDAVIVGSSIADTVRRVAPGGHVRAYDARSGRLLWTFHTIPQSGEVGAETWEGEGRDNAGAANVWSTMTADLGRGLVFLPVSSANPDFYGGDRHGANLFSDSVVALEAATGRLRWHFQTVHHDLWDYDLAAPPVLVQIRRDGRTIDALAQATKTGFVYVLDRDSGAPLFPVEERPVPKSDVPGEASWPTQPVPLRPPPLSSQRITAADLWEADAERLEKCRDRLSKLRNEGLFTPPSERGSIVHPYTAGGANWSGAAYDPGNGRLFVPVNNLAHVIKVEPLPVSNLADDQARPFRGVFAGLWYALTGRGTGHRYWTSPIDGRTLFAVDGVPCNRPPWGQLVAVDLDAGELRWQVPSGEVDGVRGWQGFGPPLVTGGGLVFHAGTRELRLRAHDTDTGEVVATFDLPAGLHAGPVTYKLRPDGKQYLVIAPGGHVGLGSKLGDYVIAYALPD